LKRASNTVVKTTFSPLHTRRSFGRIRTIMTVMAIPMDKRERRNT
jgi:hypothetical protein